MTTTTTEHGFTVIPQTWADQVCYVVMCLCGWSSPPFVRRDLAEACGDRRHVANPNPQRPAPVECEPWCCYGDGATYKPWRPNRQHDGSPSPGSR